MIFLFLTRHVAQSVSCSTIFDEITSFDNLDYTTYTTLSEKCETYNDMENTATSILSWYVEPTSSADFTMSTIESESVETLETSQNLDTTLVYQATQESHTSDLSSTQSFEVSTTQQLEQNSNTPDFSFTSATLQVSQDSLSSDIVSWSNWFTSQSTEMTTTTISSDYSSLTDQVAQQSTFTEQTDSFITIVQKHSTNISSIIYPTSLSTDVKPLSTSSLYLFTDTPLTALVTDTITNSQKMSDTSTFSIGPIILTTTSSDTESQIEVDLTTLQSIFEQQSSVSISASPATTNFYIASQSVATLKTSRNTFEETSTSQSLDLANELGVLSTNHISQMSSSVASETTLPLSSNIPGPDPGILSAINSTGAIAGLSAGLLFALLILIILCLRCGPGKKISRRLLDEEVPQSSLKRNDKISESVKSEPTINTNNAPVHSSPQLEGFNTANIPKTPIPESPESQQNAAIIQGLGASTLFRNKNRKKSEAVVPGLTTPISVTPNSPSRVTPTTGNKVSGEKVNVEAFLNVVRELDKKVYASNLDIRKEY
eukprot:NODE_425_length_7669_cov_0.863937.p1 type:complete len:544 gc:universal NODE_425_length_7669_cov_0.863937:2955-4586(+)